MLYKILTTPRYFDRINDLPSMSIGTDITSFNNNHKVKFLQYSDNKEKKSVVYFFNGGYINAQFQGDSVFSSCFTEKIKLVDSNGKAIQMNKVDILKMVYDIPFDTKHFIDTVYDYPNEFDNTIFIVDNDKIDFFEQKKTCRVLLDNGLIVKQYRRKHVIEKMNIEDGKIIASKTYCKGFYNSQVGSFRTKAFRILFNSLIFDVGCEITETNPKTNERILRNGTLVCINKETLDLSWKVIFDYAIDDLTYDEQYLYIVHHESIYRLDPATGDIIAELKLPIERDLVQEMTSKYHYR